jgi:hypothetical protein
MTGATSQIEFATGTTRIDQYDAVTRIHVAILVERRTPVRGHRFQFDVGRHAAANHDLLLRGYGEDLVPITSAAN